HRDLHSFPTRRSSDLLWPIRFEHRIPLAGKIRFDSVLFRERDGQGKGRLRARKSGDSGNAIIELLPPDRRESLASLIFPPSPKASAERRSLGGGWSCERNGQ